MDFWAYILLFLLPFERIPSVDIYGVTVRLSSLIILGFIGVGIPWLIRRGKLFPLSSIDWAILIFFLTALASVILAADLKRSLTVVLLFGFVLCGYLLVSRTFRESFNFEKITSVIILSGVVTALFGLFQFLGDAFGIPMSITGLLPRYTKEIFGFPRIQSVGLEPLYYANFLLLPISLLISRVLMGKSNPDWKSLSKLTLLLWVLVLTLSRGAYLGFIAGLIIFCFAAFRIPNAWRRLLFVGGTIIVAIGLAYGVIVAVSGMEGAAQFRGHSANSDQTRDASANPRIEHIKEAIRLFRDNPILGVGIGNYGVVNHFAKDFAVEGYQIVNNQYLETLAETGIVGLLGLLAVVGAVLTKLWHNIRQRPVDPPTLALLVATVGVAVQYNFFSTIYILLVWVLIGLVDALPVIRTR